MFVAVTETSIVLGGPLSPYLFVLCIERLSHCITDSVNSKDWIPIRLTRNGWPLTHLFFADDLILFSEASLWQAEVIKNCLETFCNSSGQKINKYKTKVYFSRNVNHTRISQICDHLGFSSTIDFRKYLGAPLHSNRVNKNTFSYITDKVDKRLGSWKEKSLSLAGRITLAKTVTSAIPNYSMQTALLPFSICDEIEKKERKFIWGSNNGSSKPHLIAWETLCKKTEQRDRFWKNLWKWKGPQRIKNFLWLASHGRILSNSLRKAKGISTSDTCSRCGNHVEDTLHILRDCEKVKPLWKNLVDPNRWQAFFSCDLRNWIDLILTKDIGIHKNTCWATLFGVTLWYIWIQRNESIFSNNNSSADILLPKVTYVTKEFYEANHIPKILSLPRSDNTAPLKWTAPTQDWIKVNVDGSCYDNQGSIACGGLCRDYASHFLKGFMRKLGRGNPFAAETWAVFHGVDYAWKSRYKKVIIESDSKDVLEAIDKNTHDNHPLEHVLKGIKAYKSYDWQICFNHVNREGNEAAQALAAIARNASFGFHSFDRIPQQCIAILAKDCGPLRPVGS
ncbi:putative ribonuclease H protein At1g65750 family [Senna tora]|uniref:Putative ribonuclease H protein At1g65750 family n=1 Tax=Senna tora TaxID=362788 RepID=A0A834XEB7_9FABA|nr:putative ribonuclease H protein At1g65750 family [Senna tora]